MTKVFAIADDMDLQAGTAQSKLTRLGSLLSAAGVDAKSGALTVFAAEPFVGALVAPAGEVETCPGFVMIDFGAMHSADDHDIAQLCRTAGWPGAIVLEAHQHEPDGITPTDDPVVRIGFITRQQHLSPEEFRRHWLESHVPLVMGSAPLFFRYVTNLAFGANGWDGVVEQWFADMKIWNEHDRRILEERPLVRADIPKFVLGLKQYVGRPVLRLAM